jgi:hypothetical protein
MEIFIPRSTGDGTFYFFGFQRADTSSKHSRCSIFPQPVLENEAGRRKKRKCAPNIEAMKIPSFHPLENFYYGEMLNNKNSQGHIGPQTCWIPEASVRFKKSMPESLRRVVRPVRPPYGFPHHVEGILLASSRRVNPLCLHA